HGQPWAGVYIQTLGVSSILLPLLGSSVLRGWSIRSQVDPSWQPLGQILPKSANLTRAQGLFRDEVCSILTYEEKKCVTSLNDTMHRFPTQVGVVQWSSHHQMIWRELERLRFLQHGVVLMHP